MQGRIRAHLRALDEASVRRNHPNWSEAEIAGTSEVRERNRARGKDKGFGSWNRRASLGVGWVLLQKAAVRAADRGMLRTALRLNRWSWRFDKEATVMNQRPDPLAPARGILIGLVLGSVLWAAIIAVVLAVTA